MKRYLPFVLLFYLYLTALTVGAQTVLVAENSVWTYLDDGSNQGTAWREIAFDDSGWAAGPAELGYGDGQATLLSFGPDANNKYITYYFRQEFSLTEVGPYGYLMLRILRDDGAVVYLNGTEICRSNMPAGTINYLTLASSAVSGTDETTFFEYLVPSAGLVVGDNLIAVELHQSSGSSSDISFNLELTTTDLAPDYFHKAPYLVYNGNYSEMAVLWQLNETIASTIEWGLDPECSPGSQGVTEYGSDHQSGYTLTGLTPNTRYFYRVIVGTDTVPGNFRTAPGPGTTSVSLFAYGDTRSYPADHDAVAAQVLLNMASDPDAQSLLLMTADLVSDGNSESLWDEQFFSPDYVNIQALMRTVPMLSCKGNHEGTGLIFRKYFSFPYVTGSYFYWSFDYGPVHVCVVDQYTSYTVGSSQYNWIVTDLQASEKPWKFLLLHEPGWSAGDGHANNTTVQTVLQPLCLQYGVQFVFCGHNHYYARAEVDGIEHLTVGGGGAPLHTPILTYPYIVAASSSHSFSKIEIEDDTLHFTAIKDDGTIIESFDYQNYHEWNGAVDTDWNNAGNWSHGVVPGEGWNVYIPQGLLNYPHINGTVSCRDLHLRAGALLTVADGSILNVYGQLTVDGILTVEDGGVVNQFN